MLKVTLMKLAALFILTFLAVQAASAANNNHFQTLFADWSAAFNQKELEKPCQLFSKNVTATYQNYPLKTYSTICDGFKKIFADSQKEYHYNFKIHQTYEDNNLAAVRITWYLQVYSNGKLIDKVQDEGLDVLQKDKNGDWKIV